MAAPSRTAQFTRLHKVLRKHYAPVVPDPNRTVLEHLLFACCLENATYTAAEEAFAAMSHGFFDLNEIRVSSLRELSETVAGLPDPPAAAGRFKRVLQSLFEATYSFDLEGLRKLNLGPAVERLEKTDGTTKFSVAYVVQAALGGHSIPLDSGTLGALAVVGLATSADLAAGAVAGMERAIPKNAGGEFASMLHQLGADFVANPYAPSLHAILLEIEPAAKSALPNRRSKRPEPEVAPPPAVPEPKPAAAHSEAKPRKAGRPKKGTTAADAKGATEPAAGPREDPAAASEPAKRSAAEKKPAGDPPPGPAPHDAKAAPPKKKPKAKASEEAAPPAQAKPAAPKKPGKKSPETPKTKEGETSQGSAVEGLSKRKPR